MERLIELVRAARTPTAVRWTPTPRCVGASPICTRAQIQRVNGLRALASLESGSPGPETSIGKLWSAPLVEDLADLAVTIAGLDAQREDADELDPRLRLAYQGRGTSIAGGTTFIQRNIVAERVLGLPRA